MYVSRLLPAFALMTEALMNTFGHLGKYLRGIIWSEWMCSFPVGKHCQIVLQNELCPFILPLSMYECPSLTPSLKV